MENNDICAEEFFDATPDIPDIPDTQAIASMTAIDDENVILDHSIHVPRDATGRQPKRSARLSVNKKTTPQKAKSSKASIKNQRETVEIGVLTAQMVTLTNALQTLEKTARQQQKEITNLKEENKKLLTELETNVESKLSTLEKRINGAWDIREKSYAQKDDLEKMNKKIEKISDHANAALQATSKGEKKYVTSDKCKELEDNIKEVQSDMNTLTNEVLTVKQTLHAQEDTTLFTPVRKQRRNLAEDLAPTTVISSGEENVDTTTKVDNTNNEDTPEKNNTLERDDSPEADNFVSEDTVKMKTPNKRQWGDIDDDETRQERSSNNKKPPLKTLMYMDSNRTFLKPDGLWRNLSMIPCQDIDTLRSLLELENFADVGVVFIHTGVNDIDTVEGEEVAKDLINIVNKLHHLHPHLKVVLSEITPRKKFKDDQVKECNRYLHNSLRDADFITIAKHSNLRNERWTFHKDDKHLTEISISLFAANIKNALRRCLGIPSKRSGKRGGQEGRRDQPKNHKGGKYMKNHNGADTKKTQNMNSFKQDLIRFLQNY